MVCHHASKPQNRYVLIPFLARAFNNDSYVEEARLARGPRRWLQLRMFGSFCIWTTSNCNDNAGSCTAIAMKN